MHKTGEFLETKIADKILKPNQAIDENPRNVKEIIVPPEKRERKNIKRIKASIIKMEHYKISKLLNNSSVSKFVTKNGSR